MILKSRSRSCFTLGVYQSPAGLRGALVRYRGETAELIHLLGNREPQGAAQELSSVSIGPSLVGEHRERFGVTLGGDGSAGAPDIFLTSEFGRIPVPMAETSGISNDLLKEDLTRMLTHCRELGADNLDLVWCLGTPHVSLEEGGSEAPGHRKGRQASSVIMKMTSGGDGSERRIVCTPKPDEPASAGIEAVRTLPDQPRLCVVDSEISAYRALLKVARASETGVSLLVRISEDDVLVLVTSEGQLRNVEVLRSLSVHDGPDMIYSRLLLLVDEFGLEKIDRLYVASLPDDSRFSETFETYFRGVEVFDLGDSLSRLSPAEQRIDGESLAAAGAALRELAGLRADDSMLAPPLRRPKQSNPFSWQVIALLAVLGISAVFFVGRYLHFDREISSRHNRIAALTHDTQTASRLRQRIDSLQAAYSVNMQGMHILDSLLVGSDKWSRTFDGVSRSMTQVGGLWIEKWQPAGAIVEIAGGARSRESVVDLARHLDGTIETITYPTGERTHYTFRMKAPVAAELPEAAQYLRELAVRSSTR